MKKQIEKSILKQICTIYYDNICAYYINFMQQNHLAICCLMIILVASKNTLFKDFT